jgi:hypothetical protein
MNTSKTMIVSILSIISGLFVALGSPLPADTVAALSNHAETILGSVMAIYGIVMGLLRMVTSTPLVSLIKKRTL